ncbi:MAG: NADH-quinone oxidoreductase subunit G, partial [Gammaproteobacteria bacterium]|nr:NADH-quinone oxidoreductase subunit G [Gammaproteobacteria bacterium]
MSAVVDQDTVTLEVDGRELKARKGQMLIEVTDAAGIYVPRFCYHSRLSIAANCRMCLVDVERAPKPLPACATPVMDGMKVATRSGKAIDAQRSTMEFLLINHPLDCPICDQGGECELQDLAMGYGGDVGRYTERKRVVRDKDIGPLVQTEMTRCIHCTRCIRFGEEIAGLRELGATGRGEHMEIGTYVEKAMRSELSGNVIDVCPVGALTSRPYRYSARAWEMRQFDHVAAHDCLGTNIHVHAKGSVIKRVVPRENDAVNEVWMSDRDRYSYTGLYHEDRLAAPRIKRDGRWQDTDWTSALEYAAEGLRAAGSVVSALLAPTATVEEGYLAQKLLRALGSNAIDHRLRESDFSDQAHAPLMPVLGTEPAALERADAVLVIGGFPRHEQPLVNLRLRKAALAGGSVMFVTGIDRELNFDAGPHLLAAPGEWAASLAAIAAAIDGDGAVEATARVIAERLAAAQNAVVLVGPAATEHVQAAKLRALANRIATSAGASCGTLSSGPNAAGLWLAGAVAHRGPGGAALTGPGSNALEIGAAGSGARLLLGIDPELDGRLESVAPATFTVGLTGYTGEALETRCDVLLPIALGGENEGTYVNAAGLWQSFAAAVKPAGEARAAWKVLRRIANMLELDG